MNEKKLAESFLREIDKIIEGTQGPFKLEDYEIFQDELNLAKFIIKQDFSQESRAKEDIKQRLLSKFTAGTFSEDELSIDDLDYAAGGYSRHKEGSGCLKCGCKRERATISANICPDCGHSRDDHV